MGITRLIWHLLFWIGRIEIQDPRSKIQVYRLNQKTKINGFGLTTWNLDLGSWILDLGSWILDLGTWILELGSWILDLGSWNQNPSNCRIGFPGSATTSLTVKAILTTTKSGLISAVPRRITMCAPMVAPIT